MGRRRVVSERFVHWGGVAVSVFIPAVLVLLGTGIASMSCDGGSPLDPCDPAGARRIDVRYGTESRQVDMGSLPGQRHGDLCLVPLDRIVQSAGLDIDMDRALFDFEGEDGFRPSQVGCAPLDGATLAHGWADMSTGTLVWEESLGLRGCYSVTKAAAILASDPE